MSDIDIKQKHLLIAQDLWFESVKQADTINFLRNLQHGEATHKQRKFLQKNTVMS